MGEKPGPARILGFRTFVRAKGHSMMRAYLRTLVFGLACLFLLPVRARADLSGPQKILFLRVYFSDVTSATRFTATEVETYADDINTLWGTDTSYGTISLSIQVSSLYPRSGRRIDFGRECATMATSP